MHFYVDESGNTGQHLFDANQPSLYYGVLCCRKNLDVIAKPLLTRLRSELGVDRLHANQLGVARLQPVYELFSRFQKANDVRFNFYTVRKPDHAVISYFDQVFDSGTNEAVTWHHYWTPLRYILLLKVAHLFDEELAKSAWDARLTQSQDECFAKFIEVSKELRSRVELLPDLRSREIIYDAILWAENNFDSICYGASNSESALQISPNLVGFQQVLHGIGTRAHAAKRKVRSIIVDQQTEFNMAQKFINDTYKRMRKVEMQMPPGMPDFDWSTLSDIDIDFKAGADSFGLEMVDVYLWTMKRIEEEKPMSDEGRKLIYGQRHRGMRDEVSLAGISNRWKFLLSIPEPDAEEMQLAKKRIKSAEQLRLKAIKGLQ